MIRLCLKIWIVANLLVFLLFAISLFPGGFKTGTSAIFYSCLFSSPAIAFLYFLLRLLRYFRGHVLFSWILLLAGTALIAFVSYYLCNLSTALNEELNFILPLSFVCGFSAVLFLSPSLHYLFQTFQYENEIDNY